MKVRKHGKRGNGEGSIFRRKDGRWAASLTIGYDHSGRQQRKHYYGRTRSEVLKKLDDGKRALADGRPLCPERYSVGQFLVRWLQEVAAPPHVSPKTNRTYSDLIAKHLAPELGCMDLQKLGPQHVQAFINAKLESGLSRTTVKHCRDCLRAALNIAMRWNLLVRNAAAVVKLPPQRKRQTLTYTRDQARQFITAIRGHRLEALYMVALCMGAREGEVLGLAVSDADLENKTLHIRGSLQRVGGTALKTVNGTSRRTGGKLQLVPTKTQESVRCIRLPDVVISSLARRLAEREQERIDAGSDWVETGRLFTTRRGTMLDPRNMLRDYYSIRDVSGLPKIRFHDLRHSAATLLRAAGVPTQAISKLLGHSSPRTTDDIYTHVNDDMETQAAEKMDEIMAPRVV